MKDSYSAEELAAILGISGRAVRKKGMSGGWQFTDMPNGRGGGTRKLYVYAALPKEIRDRIDAHELERVLTEVGRSCAWVGLGPAGNENGSGTPVPVNGNGNSGNGTDRAVYSAAIPPAVGRAAPTAILVPNRADKVGLAKYRLIHTWRQMVVSQPWGKRGEATQVFLTAYRSGQLLPGVYHTLGDLSEKTLYQLDKRLRLANDDYRALCDGRGGWKKHGTTRWRPRSLPRAAQEVLLQCYLRPNRPTFVMAHRAALKILEKRGIRGDDLPAVATWRRWYDEWSETHHDMVVLGREGEKAYLDQCAPYITRNTADLEVGQVLVADGHDLNFEILHPETGRPCRMKLIVFFDWASRMPAGWQIMPTENVTAIHAALRNSILNLGKYPKVVYLDNGRAFKARFFTDREVDLEELRGLYSRLGIATIFAEAYRARSKVIERFFRTFKLQCEEAMPSYCGGSINEKPAWRFRNEKFHQAWHEARTGGWVPNLREAAYFISLYIRWYGEQPHSGIDGRRPLDVLHEGLGPGVDTAELNEQFLWRVPVTPRRCRIRLYGIDYESDCLHGLRPEKGAVIAHVDLADLSRIYCYLPGGKYLGEAVPVQALPAIARILGDEIGVDRVKEALKRQRRLARETKQKLIESGVTTEMADAVTTIPWQEKVVVLSGGKANDGSVAKAFDPGPAQRPKQQPEEIPEEEARRLELVVSRAAEEMAREAEGPFVERPTHFDGEMERYEWCFRARHQYGARLSEEDEAFMAYIELSAQFESHRQRYADLLELYALIGPEQARQLAELNNR